ncbi:hypothetical protein C8J56DRAFT_891653 [Mycena floridula]|nr:hypothetical protein C8J56DRAFT_891653 [Mycena floridula]
MLSKDGHSHMHVTAAGSPSTLLLQLSAVSNHSLQYSAFLSDMASFSKIALPPPPPGGLTCTFANCDPFEVSKMLWALAKTEQNYGRPFSACNGGQNPSIANHFFRWETPTPPMVAAPVFSSTQGYPIASAPPPATQNKLKCATYGCTSRRVASQCGQPAGVMCATHCRKLGGCTVPAHVIDDFGIASGRVSTSRASTSQSSTQFRPPSTISRAYSPPMASFETSPSPPSSMQPTIPIANRHLKSQLQPVFTSQRAVEQELQEKRRQEIAKRKENEQRAKQNVEICLWREDNSAPEESAFQDGFLYPNFQLTADVLLDLGLHDIRTLCFYRFSTMTWVTIRPNHQFDIQHQRTILLRTTNVAVCQGLDERVEALLTRSTNMWDSLAHQRKAVEKKNVAHFISNNQVMKKRSSNRESYSPPMPTTSSKRAKRKERGGLSPVQSRFTGSPSPTPEFIYMNDDISSQPAPTSSEPDTRQSSVISLSSTSPSPPPPRVKRERLSTPISLNSSHSSMPSIDTALRSISNEQQVQHPSQFTSSSQPRQSSQSHASSIPSKPALTIRPHRQAVWPADFFVVDIVNSFAKFHDPAESTTAELFIQFFRKPFKSSTFYENRKRW